MGKDFKLNAAKETTFSFFLFGDHKIFLVVENLNFLSVLFAA